MKNPQFLGNQAQTLHYTLDFFKSDHFLKLMVELRVCTHAWYHLKGHYIWKFLTNYWFPLLSFKDFIAPMLDYFLQNMYQFSISGGFFFKSNI